MKHVLVNAANLTGAGARAIGISLIPELALARPDWRFTVLAPALPQFHCLALPENTVLRPAARSAGMANAARRMAELLVTVPQSARRANADVCLTMGDLSPVGLPCPSVLFVQQAMLVYQDRELAGQAAWPWWKRRMMQGYFAATAAIPGLIIVQTAVMGERLCRRYGIPPGRVRVVQQPVPQGLRDALADAVPCPAMARCPKPIKLLFLAGGYRHKNHAVLPAVASAIRQRGLADRVQVFTTTDQTAGAGARAPADGDIITNLDPLSGPEVAGALRAATALFLPTLVESYGLIYLEAMTAGLPILTSDRDFAREMCGELALYFDPLDAGSIVDAIERLGRVAADRCLRERLVARSRQFPQHWRQVAATFIQALREVAR